MPSILLPTPAGSVRAHLAAPVHQEPRPGVVVIHEAFGLNDEIRGHANRFAAQGYVAVAPDLFSYGPKLRCMRDTFRSLVRKRGPAFDVLDAVAGWLAAREDCTGRVGVIGYCLGGGFALLAAPRHTYAAASVNYGLVPKDAEELLRGACPIIGSFGADDRAMRGAAGRLEAALTAAGVDHEVTEYPGAGHSFLNQHTGAVGVLSKVVGAGYRPGPAREAQRRIDAFFAEHLH
jgi:carboxymethylenebutenolidase